jgi:hypothetical protein
LNSKQKRPLCEIAERHFCLVPNEQDMRDYLSEGKKREPLNTPAQILKGLREAADPEPI